MKLKLIATLIGIMAISTSSFADVRTCVATCLILKQPAGAFEINSPEDYLKITTMGQGYTKDEALADLFQKCQMTVQEARHTYKRATGELVTTFNGSVKTGWSSTVHIDVKFEATAACP